jgi:hypothetical protein
MEVMDSCLPSLRLATRTAMERQVSVNRWEVEEVEGEDSPKSKSIPKSDS